MSTTTTHDDPLVPRLRELLCAAVRGWRKGARFGGAIATVVSDGLIDEIATRWAPLQRDVAYEAAGATWEEKRPEIEAMVQAAVRAELDAADLAVVAETGTRTEVGR